MAFNVSLYTFSKKVNSTARPGAPAATYGCRIKEPCGILAPTISLNLGLVNSPHAYNYAYIAEFDRYYYIREWTFENALWNASMEVDTLASWKTSIGASTCYILRSSNEYNLDIIDATYPGTNVTTLGQDSTASPWQTSDIENGSFVVGIAGQSTTYYIFPYGSLNAFFNLIFSDSYAEELTTGWATEFPQLKAQSNPLQYITSIMWYPFSITGTEVTSIKVGWVDVDIASTVYKVDGNSIENGSLSFDIERHPQAARGSYLNNAPFTTYTLFFPPWGKIQLDPDIMANSTVLYADYSIDLRTGQGTLVLKGAWGHVLSWLHSQIGVEYQVSQIINRGYGLGNLIAPVAEIGASIASGRMVGAITSTVSEIGNAAASKIPSATTIGSNGGINSLLGLPTLQHEFKEIVDEDLSHRGRPLCENRQINTIPGFILVADADISVAATKAEQDSIRSFMEGGFFYE